VEEGVRRFHHIALLVDDEIKVLKADDRSRGVFDARVASGTRDHGEIPRWRRSGFLGPDRFAFTVEGEVDAVETDRYFRRPIGIMVGHPKLEELSRECASPT
jgi:hypothetical protein